MSASRAFCGGPLAGSKLVRLVYVDETGISNPAQEPFVVVFHAKELFNGGGKVFTRDPPDEPNPKWPLERRLRIADDLALIPKRFGLDIALGLDRKINYEGRFRVATGDVRN